jgi:hypothetical protein
MMMMTDGRRELEKHARQLPIAASRGQKQDKKMLQLQYMWSISTHDDGGHKNTEQ